MISKYKIFLNQHLFPLNMAKAKIGKKEWYPILAPRIFGNEVLGETYVYEPRQMIGKTMAKNLMNLTNDVKKQNININFEIVDVKSDKALTDVVGYHMMQSSIRRLVRRNIEKIDMSFPCKTKDNKNLLVKPLLITRSATVGSVASKIRRNTEDFLVKYIDSISYDNLINDLINHKLQNSLRKEINNIYPLRVCEIRSMEIVDLERKKETKAGKKPKVRAERAEKGKDIEKKEETQREEERTEQESKETLESEEKEPLQAS